MGIKLPLKTILGALDNKDMGFYDRLTPEQQKQLSPFLLNRYMSIVKGSKDLASYYLLATNQNVNVMYFDLAIPKINMAIVMHSKPGNGKAFSPMDWFQEKKCQ